MVIPAYLLLQVSVNTPCIVPDWTNVPICVSETNPESGLDMEGFDPPLLEA